MVNKVNIEEVIAEFEALTKDAKRVQEETLRKILQENIGAEYLQQWGLEGKTDPDTYRSRVPLVTHSDLDPYIQRGADGESNLLTRKPFTALTLSSGTSQGKSKFIPFNHELTQNTMQISRTSFAYRNREFPIGKGTVLDFIYGSKESKTRGGLSVGTATTLLYQSSEFWETMEALQTPCCTPKDVIFGSDFQQSLYCHLLCGLIFRDEIQLISSTFCHSIVHSFQTFELIWEELCADIRNGVLSTRITDPSIRCAMEKILKPDPELADLIYEKCMGLNDWYGLIPEIFPNAKYIYGIMTGSMLPYLPKLRHYGGSLPLLSADYGASEGWIGANVNPTLPPEKTTFAVVPNFGYFEFIPLREQDSSHATVLSLELKPVGLTEVMVGEEYEVVVTNFAGLYRYRLGDVVKVKGFYNSTPELEFIRRNNLLLSINIDKNTEEDLELCVKTAAKLLAEVKLELVDFTSQVDHTTEPAHYVVYWEVSGEANEDVLKQCCNCLDTSFVDLGYKTARSVNAIGPLELRVLGRGTFQKLLHHYVGMGSALNQFKTPRCIGSANKKVLQILVDNVVKSISSTAFA